MYSPSILKTIILIPIILIIPGAVIVLYVRDRSQADLILSEIIFLSLGISVAVSSFAGLVLAELGQFSLTKLSIVLLSLSALVAIAWLIRRKGVERSWSKSPWWWVVGLLLLIIISSFLFIGRSEPMLNEADPRPYLVEGVNIAQNGKIPLVNRMLPQLSEDEVVLLYGEKALRGDQEYGTHLWDHEYATGFLIEDPAKGEVRTRYFPLYSVMIAISYRLLGLRATLTVMNPFLAILALLLIVLLVRRLLGGKIALLAGLILVVNPLMVWFARYPIPEFYAQLMVTLGIFCFALYYPWGERPSGKGYWGLLSAVAFSLAPTAKFDLYLILFPLAGIIFLIYALKVVRREKFAYLLWFVLPLVLFVFHGWVGQKIFSGRYLQVTSSVVPRFIRSNILLISILGLIALAALPYLFRLITEHGKIDKGLDIAKKYWRPALAILLLAMCIFAFLVLPYISWGRNASEAQQKATFQRMSWYFGYIGVIIFIIGLVIFVMKNLDQRTLAFFLMGTSIAVMLFYNPLCAPIHMWFLRRFIPVVIPFMGILMAYGLIKAPQSIRERRARKMVAGAAVVALVAVLVFTSLYTAKIKGVVQYGGSLESTQELAVRLKGKEKVAIFYDAVSRGYYADTLRYIFGVNSLPLASRTGDPKVFAKLIDKLWSQGKEVYMVSTIEEPPEIAKDFDLVDQQKLEASFELLEQEGGRRPDIIVHESYPIYIRKLQRRNTSSEEH